jgi:uncharacterized membrane protein
MEELTVNLIINEGIKKGIRNALAIFVNCLLWLITIWIPYLNVGTTIGLLCGLVPKISKDEELSYTEVFNPEYRKKMGEVFVALPLVIGGIVFAFYCLIIPGIVLSIAWSLVYYLIVDKNMHPLEAIKKSNEATYGKKWIIFFGFLVLYILIGVALGIIVLIASALGGSPVAAVIFGLILIVLFFIAQCIIMGAQAVVYKTLIK